MAQFREAIELLTKIFRENGASKIKAETVRQAKFNKNEATPSLWRLLFELIYYSQYQCIDNTAIKAVSELSSEELSVFVKREMQDRGFVSRELMVLPTDMSYGSRELLLAIGWLMCKEHIMDAFMMNCTSPLEEDIVTWTEREEEESEELTTPRDPSQRVQQLLWHNNKLRLNLRSLHALQRQKETLDHKIHEATQGVSLTPDKNHLSVMEVYLLRHPDLLKKNLQLLEKDNERLQNLLKWKSHEDTFWKWMESVLDGKLQELVAAGDRDEASSVASSEPRTKTGSKTLWPRNTDTPTSSILQLAETHLDLREAIIKYEAIVDYLERLWAQKSEDLSEAEIDSVLASINLELSIQRASIALNNTETYVMEQPQKPQGPTQWKLEPPTPPKRMPHHSLAAKQASVDEDDSGSDTWRDIEEEIVSLQKTVRKLEEDISGQQQNYVKHLQGLADNLVDNVVIPPMSAINPVA